MLHRPGIAADEAQAQARVGGDVFVAGGDLAVREPVAGDLFAAGGNLDLGATVGGDALAAAGKLRLAADVGRSVYAAAGDLAVHGKIGHHARLAGGQVELGPSASVAGNLAVAGGHIRLLGAVHGDVSVTGGRLRIDGPVDGDVLATTGGIELGPNARIAGKLRYRGGESVQRDPAAQVVGGIEAWGIGWGRDASHERARHRDRAPFAAASWAWTIGLVVLAALMLAALPRFHARVGLALQEHPALSVLLGFVWLVCAPVALLFLLLTVVGIPLALLGAALYVVLLPLAYVSAAIALGDWGLRALRNVAAGRWPWRAAAAALVLVLLAQAAQVPWLGALLGLLVLLAGLGALALQLRPRRSPGP